MTGVNVVLFREIMFALVVVLNTGRGKGTGVATGGISKTTSTTV